MISATLSNSFIYFVKFAYIYLYIWYLYSTLFTKKNQPVLTNKVCIFKF